MATDQNAKQNNQDARAAEAAKANFDRAADKTAEQGKQFADAARESVNKVVDLSEKASESTKQVMQNSIETASSRPVRQLIASPRRWASRARTASVWRSSPSRTLRRSPAVAPC